MNIFPPILIFILSIAPHCAWSQKYVLEKSFVSFYSHATIEDIKAGNTKTVSLFNTATGEVAFAVPITEFQFEKSLMKEHFNEKYMESERYPTATFQGKITGFAIESEGVQQAIATGKLTIHGVTKDVEIKGTAEKQGDKLIMKTKFIVKLEDYKVARPQILWKNIAEQVEVTVDFIYKPQ
ncbi:MAG TPA: YceI family protein [Ohtaekwangia sp.]|uniref:YceI family protein n=1 Tax=Ohtaekwangia sp. TaxID=2066019 RepID=UPI002F9336B9